MTHSTDTNLFSVLRSGFPGDLSEIAIETSAGQLWTWGELERGSARIANLLMSLNLPAQSRIAVQVDKSVEALLLYLATLRSGNVFVPLNTAYQEAEMAHFIADAAPAVIVCMKRNRPWMERFTQADGMPLVFDLDGAGGGSLMERAKDGSELHVPVARAAGDLAAILYTSGTTGRSKGAMLTHGNLISNAAILSQAWDWRRSDVLIHALPIFHVHGLFVAIHNALLQGSKMLWMSRFEPAAAIELLPRATVFMGVPTLYVRMLAEPTLLRDSARNMRLFVSGSAPLLAETFHAWRECTGHTILERYGMSETLMLTSNPCRPEDGERRAGTVGRALPGVEVRVANDRDQCLPVGEIGDVQVRGPSVFKGYWNQEEKTREEFTADAWFRTGDVGYIDEQGYLSIVGRSKDLIISGGYNIYPAEVESYINEVPGVLESAVVGVPHPDFGEVGVAAVVLRRGTHLEPEAILSTLKARLAHFKVPKRSVIVPSLPRNAMGKVQKGILRQEFGSLFQ